MARDLLAAHDAGRVEVAIGRAIRGLAGSVTLHLRHYGHRRQSDFYLHLPTS
jgi:hypothetical protein